MQPFSPAREGIMLAILKTAEGGAATSALQARDEVVQLLEREVAAFDKAVAAALALAPEVRRLAAALAQQAATKGRIPA